MEGVEGGGGGGGGGGKEPKKSMLIEQIYQKKSQLEHILLRPDSYIGSVEKVTENMWVFDKEKGHMIQRDLMYVPGLYKIFDEILVNAADNKQRDATMDCIKITIDPEENMVSVWNNGEGIPVVMHKEEKMYVPTLIFGHLLTSSNYNDEEEKVTGGRNGFGAKLCNIFSNKFTVETSSKKYKKAFKQTWKNNMGHESEVKIKDSHGDDYTKVTFHPDLSKFKMETLDRDIVDLMSRRAYDVAASTRGVKVFLNGTRLPVKNFKDYVELYKKGSGEDEGGTNYPVVYESCGTRWEVAVTVSEKSFFQQVSFVNSIATTKGGRHVDYICDMITKQVIEQIKKKNKGGMQVKPFQVKSHMWLFVNCLIVNPTFDSQTKENMTLQVKNFGSKCTLTDKFMNSLLKCGLVEQVISWAKFKAQTQLDKASSGKKVNKLKGVPKLEDANDAGTKHSLDCTLILTEGDSAKTLAVAGLSVIGRDRYGIFPLRGKLLNVREASYKQILDNAEINNIIKIMGLKYKVKYESREDMATLRYGKIMIMTDQDQDGSHIKGLIVNFIHTNWPSLIRMPFLEVFITPLVKAFKGSDAVESFFSLPECEEWKSRTPNFKSYQLKYYKGLGTNTSKEAKEYFSNMERHRILFKYSGPECDQAIIMAFSKKCADQRKEWLTNWMTERKRRKEMGLPEEYLYTKGTKFITYKDFVNKELVLFSNMDNERSIPSMVDGFKPGQRKVIHTCFKRNDKKDIKVAQLAGSVAEHSAYHHGEVSLMGTIINLAQNFVGSNNINLLQPIGQFGTRLQGGKDAASPRYIFTKLSPLARHIFNPLDDPILDYQFEDNQKIEPVWFVPIIPMVLVNGAEGIGTGWATKITNYNPRELVINLQSMITTEQPSITLKPWYKGFKGTIEPLIDGKYVVNGELSILDEEMVEITELPVGVWTQNYKETVLEPMINGTDKTPACITEYKEHHTDVSVRFVISMTTEKLNKAEDEGLHKFFKLQNTISTSLMYCFDRGLCLRKFDNAMDVLTEFYHLRLEYYNKRKDYVVGMLGAEASKLSHQARFIVEKCSGDLVVENKKKKDMIKELMDRKYPSDPVKEWKENQQSLQEQMAEAGAEDDEEGGTSKDSSDGPDYNYLLGITMWSLTLEKKEELIKKKDEKVAELNLLKLQTPGDLWKKDLDEFVHKLDEVEKKEREEQMTMITGVKAGKPKTGKGAKDSGARRKNAPLDILPAANARLVQPVISDDLKKKAETAVRLKQKKQNKTKKGDDDEEDEFDKIEKETSKSLAERLGNSPSLIEKKFKQAKTTKQGGSPKGKSPKKGGAKKVKSLTMDTSDEDMSGASSGEAPANLQPTRTLARRSTAKNIKFSFDDDEGSEFSSDEDDVLPAKETKKTQPVVEKKEVKEEPAPVSMVDDSDSDMDFGFPNSNGQSAEQSFDRLINNIDSSDDIVPETNSSSKETSKGKAKKTIGDEAKKTKPRSAPKKKAAANSDSEDSIFMTPEKKAKKPKAPKKRKGKGSDSEDQDKPAKKRAPKKKKKDSSEEEADFVVSEESSPISKKPVSNRARKPVSYNFSDSDMSE